MAHVVKYCRPAHSLTDADDSMHANHKAITEARHKLGTTLNWLLEPVCFLCEESGEWRYGLCKHCWQHLPHNHLCCRICALPLASEGLCGACQATSMAYDRIIAPTVYRHPIDQMLCSLKYAGRLQWARTAAGLIVDCALQQNLDLPQLLLPVPMTRKAVRRRGFNQSAYIARLVGRQLKIKVDLDVVHKTRETHRQSTLSRSRSQQNITGALILSRTFTKKKFAIVDDVVTICSTVAELAGVLKAAEAVGVDV